MNRCKFGAALVLTLAALAAAALAAPLAMADAPHDPTAAAPNIYEAVLLAVARGADVERATLQLEQAAAAEISLLAAQGWRFDAVGGYRYSERIAEVPVDDPPPGWPTTVEAEIKANAPHATIAARRSLFLGPSTRLDLDSAGRQRSMAALQLESAMRSNALSAYQAYRQLETALLQWSAANNAAAVAAERVTIAEAQRQEGTITDVALTDARLAQRESRDRVASMERMLDLAAEHLSYLLGLETPLSWESLPAPLLEDELRQIENRANRYWPEAMDDVNLEELVAHARDGRAEVQQALEHLALAQNERARVDLQKRPTVSAEANYAWSEKASASVSIDNDGVLQGRFTGLQTFDSDWETMPELEKPKWDVGIQVTWNLWDSGLHAVSAKRADAAVAQAQSGVDQARRGVELDVRQKRAELHDARARLLLANERALLAQATLAVEEERAALGLSTPLAVAFARSQLDAAVAGAFAARVEFELAYLKLLDSAATPMDDLLSEIRALAEEGKR